MTEQQWLDCTDPTPMLELLRGKVSERKWRLLACACCRRVWHLLRDPRHRAAVVAAERLADGEITPEEMVPVADDSYSATFHRAPYKGGAAHLLVRHFSSYDDWDETYRCPPLDNTAMAAGMVAGRLRAKERATQAAMLRCIFGNPFHPLTIDPVWLTPTVTNLAAAAYEERTLPSGELDPASLAVLDDALLDAGCAEAAVIDHLRGPGPHVRGCFVIDLLIGKE
jgi:hypothetical protein